MQTELLAPAKDKETAFAAIDCGADAVYIGASAFGARHNATNSIDDIIKVVEYAHKFWAKVFVTVNTILTDNELEEAMTLIKILDKIGVDAIIVQDMGIIKQLIDLQKEYKLTQDENKHITIPVHISTQCDNRFSEKIEFFHNLGLSRVVLARELSLKQIKEIHDNNPNIELEAFIHGALCVSYSGQCYLSQYIGGRSANRGECAQPCRKKYTVINSDGKAIAKDIYALCLKDFNASMYLKDMVEAGVYSYKIEGRLKDVNYVKNVTAYYRHELDKYSQKSSSGLSFITFEPNPEKSFNRGFTTYFLKKRENCFNFESPKFKGEYIGKVVNVKNGVIKVKTQKNINSQDGLTNGKIGFLVNKVQNGDIYPNHQVDIKVGDNIYRNVDIAFERELNQVVKRQIAVNIIIDNNITAIDEDGIKASVDIPEGDVALNKDKVRESYVKQFSKMGDSDFYLKNLEIIATDLPFLPISKINEIRRMLLEKLLHNRLISYKREKQRTMNYVSYYKENLDYRSNVHNKDAKEFYEKCGAKVKDMSLECKMPEKDVELMRTKHCIKYALGMCKSSDKLYLKDEKGSIYPLKFDCKNCEMVVLRPEN